MQKGLIDIHCHILPGLDDGPADREESLKMLRLAQRDGITGIVATPHILTGVYDNTHEMIKKAVSELREYASEIELYAGAEVRICADLATRIRDDSLSLINGRNFLLLELPTFLLPPLPVLGTIISDLKAMNITPIISHPERNLPLKNDLPLMNKLRSLGALFQVTAASICEQGETRKSALTMIRRGSVHVVASDAHDASQRPPLLSKAYWKISDDFSEAEAKRLFQDNPLKIIRGERVQ